MTDATTRQRLLVSRAVEAGPYIIVPISQLDSVEAVLTANQIPYWVDEEALSIDGGPEVTWVNFGRAVDPDMVQRLLDGVSAVPEDSADDSSVGDGERPMNEQWRSRITIEPGKRGGRPCIRSMRMTVYDVLSYLAAGMSPAEILDDFPYLTQEDIQACLAFAAERERRMVVAGP